MVGEVEDVSGGQAVGGVGLDGHDDVAPVEDGLLLGDAARSARPRSEPGSGVRGVLALKLSEPGWDR